MSSASTVPSRAALHDRLSCSLDKERAERCGRFPAGRPGGNGLWAPRVFSGLNSEATTKPAKRPKRPRDRMASRQVDVFLSWPWVKIQIVIPVHIPIPTQIPTNMGGAPTPKWYPVGFDPQPFGPKKLALQFGVPDWFRFGFPFNFRLLDKLPTGEPENPSKRKPKRNRRTSHCLPAGAGKSGPSS